MAVNILLYNLAAVFRKSMKHGRVGPFLNVRSHVDTDGHS